MHKLFLLIPSVSLSNSGIETMEVQHGRHQLWKIKIMFPSPVLPSIAVIKVHWPTVGQEKIQKKSLSFSVSRVVKRSPTILSKGLSHKVQHKKFRLSNAPFEQTTAATMHTHSHPLRLEDCITCLLSDTVNCHILLKPQANS